MAKRLRSEDGFALVELLAAMVILSVALLALVAAFQSGAAALRRSGSLSTATTLANSQLEAFRALDYARIGLDPASLVGLDSTYTGDAAFTAGTQLQASCAGSLRPSACTASRPVTGPDGRSYRLDTYVTSQTPAGGRDVKQVTIVVRDGANVARTLARDASTFFDTSS